MPDRAGEKGRTAPFVRSLSSPFPPFGQRSLSEAPVPIPAAGRMRPQDIFPSSLRAGGEAIHAAGRGGGMDCFVASLLAMTVADSLN